MTPAEGGRGSGRTSLQRYLEEARRLARRGPQPQAMHTEGTGDEGGSAVSPDAGRSRRDLVESNLLFVAAVAREYSSLGIPLDDLLSEGNIGLIEAAERFDPRRGTLFVTYASWWIRKRILNLLARQMSVVRLPKQQLSRLRIIRSSEATLRAGLGRAPTVDEIAREACLETAEVERLLVIGQRELSLEHVVNAESGRRLEDVVTSDDAAGADSRLLEEDFLATIGRMLDALPVRERTVIELRFGFDEGPPKTLQAIADIIGLSRERVRQIESTALMRLRRMMNREDTSDRG